MKTESRWTRNSAELEADEREASAEAKAQQHEDVQGLLTGRLRLVVFAFVLFFAIVLTRLVFWQFFDRAAAQQVTPPLPDSARGRIVDSNWLLLATDTFVWDIYVNPQDYHYSRVAPEKLLDYATIMGVPAEALQVALAQDAQSALVVREATAGQCVIANEHEDLPYWIWCDGRRERSYPQGSLGAHVLGLVNRDQVGQTGVESTYDAWLRRVGTWPVESLPGAPTTLPDEAQVYLPSPAGLDLVLNLNGALQYIAEKALADALTRYDAVSGTIIIMDPRTGAIYAMAVLPTYDPNSYADYEPANWVNTAVYEAYEPGSVMKVASFAAAIDAGATTPDSTFEDPGQIEVTGKPIYNSEKRSYGVVTVRQALALSLNVVTARICLGMDRDDFYRSLRQFGFGRKTESDLGVETPGLVKRPGMAFWSIYDQAATSFGQGVTVTPLQMLNAVSAIANDGILMQPRVVRSLIHNGQVYEIPPRELGRAIKAETARTMTQMLTFTVDSYSAGPELVPGFRVAGKTGTAEIPTEDGYTSEQTITTFAGFLPAANPQVAILVKIAEPKTSRWAEHVALPVFGEVARAAVDALRIAPDERMP